MSLVPEQWSFLKDVSKLIAKAEELGIVMSAGELWRPQAMAWVNSLPAKSTLTGVDPNNNEMHFWEPVGGAGIQKSLHMSRLAVDFNFFDANFQLITDMDKIKPLGEYWQSLSEKNRWGGSFTTRKDYPHFERNVA